MTGSGHHLASTVVRRVAKLSRAQPSGLFVPDDPHDVFAVGSAQLWTKASERARRLGADEPLALSIECGSGAVVAVREGGRLLVGVAAAGVPPSAARYELTRRFEA